MLDLEFIIELFGVAMLSSYLCLKHRQRARIESGRHPPAKWTAKPIDVTKLKPSVEAVRRDYLAARQSTRGNFFRRRLLGLVRRRIAQLSYFHDRESEVPAQTDDP